MQQSMGRKLRSGKKSKKSSTKKFNEGVDEGDSRKANRELEEEDKGADEEAVLSPEIQMLANPFAAIPTDGMRNSLLIKNSIQLDGLLDDYESSDEDDVSNDDEEVTIKDESRFALSSADVVEKFDQDDDESPSVEDDISESSSEGTGRSKLKKISKKKPLRPSDKTMVMRFLSKNHKARGLEDRVIDNGCMFRRSHVKTVLGAQQIARDEAHEDVWGTIQKVSADASLPCQYMANQLAEFDEMEARKEDKSGLMDVSDHLSLLSSSIFD